MRVAVLFSIGVALFSVGQFHALAQTPEPVGDRFERAMAMAQLDSQGLKPWHLKMSVNLYDKDGKNPQPGTIEVWAADGQLRTVETFGVTQRTVLRTRNGLFASSSDSNLVSRADNVLEQVLKPGLDHAQANSAKWKLHSQKFGNTQLDCFEPSWPSTFQGTSVGLGRVFCVNPANERLVFTKSGASEAWIREPLGKFEGKDVPMHLQLVQGRIILDDASIDALSTFTPEPSFFEPTPTTEPVTGILELPQSAMPGSLLNSVPPIYPPQARAAHRSGEVKIEAVIGIDGHVQSQKVLQSPDPSLSQAAQDAVHQWIYRPYTMNGVPIPVRTIIRMNFNLG